MTIRSDRDHGQRCRPRMSCLKKVEATVVQMQDPSTGVKGTNQKLNITTIPHAITGQDIVAWITKNMNMDNDEAQAFSTMLVAFGYIYPLQDHKKLVLRPDGSLYRFQEEYNKLHKWMNHKWDFIVMQAKEQYHAGKARQKADRVVFDCQERAYWIVHRPPPQTHSAMDYGLDRHIDPNVEEVTGENLAFWEAAEELKWGTAASMSEKAEHIFKTFLAPGAPRWINIDGRTMGLTVKGLEHPHRYVFDAAQTHIFMLMKKDTFYRYLNEAQLQQNMRNRRPSVSPIITWQKEQEEKAKAAAAAGPIDIKKLMASKLDRK
ncbi:hypothetical protein cypCar_00005903 [Cyprinus carpio]|nr:hypothetical protein cypCar_00005903 [Cyprinus carpio]